MKILPWILILGITASCLAQQSWVKSPTNPITLDAPFAVESMSDPTLYFDGQLFHLWISGGGFVPNNPTPSIRTGYYTSEDFIHWDPAPDNPVLREAPAGEWDSGHIETTHILKQEDEFWLYYCATPDTAANDAEQLHFGLVTSADGATWTRHPDNPILYRGNPEDWDSRWIESPCVLKVDNTYFMWYNGIDMSWRIHIGLATSEDGIHWTKHPENPVLSPDPEIEWQSFVVYAPQVRWLDGQFIMLYTGMKLGETTYDFSDMRTGLAVSVDGVHWERSQSPVMTGTPGTWDEVGPFTLDWIADGDSLKMLYTSNGIGTAVSTPIPTIVEEEQQSHMDWPMLSNYPNPFNSSTCIHYRLNQSEHISLTIWDVNGRLIRTLVNARQQSGSYEMHWNGQSRQNLNTASGVYVLRLKTNTFQQSRRIILLH